MTEVIRQAEAIKTPITEDYAWRVAIPSQASNNTAVDADGNPVYEKAAGAG